MIPIGRYGCNFCTHFQSPKCALRNLDIPNPASTTCGAVSYNSITRAVLKISDEKFNSELENLTQDLGSVIAITDSEGDCLYVPWLEFSEVKTVNTRNPCFECARTYENSRLIRWNDTDYYFCSFYHYLQWRNKVIEYQQVQDEILGHGVLFPFEKFLESRFKELQLRNSSEEVPLEEPKSERSYKFISGVVVILTIKFGIIIYNSIFR